MSPPALTTVARPRVLHHDRGMSEVVSTAGKVEDFRALLICPGNQTELLPGLVNNANDLVLVTREPSLHEVADPILLIGENSFRAQTGKFLHDVPAFNLISGETSQV